MRRLATASPRPYLEGDARRPPLLGAWAGEDGTSFVFRDGGEALWVFPADTFRLRYAYDPAPMPAHLDLTGFARGPLQGRTLSCIVQAAGEDAFRMDCEPGGPDSRPAAFTGQTRTYRRP